MPPGGSDGKASAYNAYLACGRHGFNPWVRKISRRRKWQPTPVFLPGKSHGWWNLVGCSPWGRKESDMTEQLHFHFKLLQSCSTLWTVWTVAGQIPLSVGFSRQEYWSGVPYPPSGDLPNPGIELMSLASSALAGRFFTISATWEALQFFTGPNSLFS